MFEPWIGNHFGREDNILAGCRLMILGESHYTKDPGLIGTTPENFTPGVVNWFVHEGNHNPFFANLSAAVLGTGRSKPSSEDMRALWDSVIFYNYVPVLVDGRSSSEGGNDRRPLAWMFEAGAEAFKVMQARHKPQAVLVCGLTLWSWLAPQLNGFEGPERDVIFYDDGRSLFARTHHPSYRNFDRDTWTARIRELMERSAEPRQAGLRILWNWRTDNIETSGPAPSLG